VQSNDPLVQTLAHPRVVDITPGKFRIGAVVFGSFELVVVDASPKSGMHVAMSMYNLRLLRRTYKIVPMNTDRMALFGTGRRNDIFYVLQRLNAC
jgi:hypothetical protein